MTWLKIKGLNYRIQRVGEKYGLDTRIFHGKSRYKLYSESINNFKTFFYYFYAGRADRYYRAQQTGPELPGGSQDNAVVYIKLYSKKTGKAGAMPCLGKDV